MEFNQSTGRELIGVMDFKGEIYTRQDQINGILLGTYEKAAKPWSPVNTPSDFGHELLAPDIDRIAPSLEVGFKHFPGIEKAGIKTNYQWAVHFCTRLAIPWWGLSLD